MRQIKVIIATVMLALFLSTPLVYAADEVRFSADYQGTKLYDTLMALAYRANKNLVVNGSVEGIVYLTLKNKTISESIDLLASAHNFSYTIKDDVIVVTPEEEKIKTSLQTFVVKHADLKFTREQIALFVPDKKISVNTDYSTITVDGTPGQIKKVTELLNQIDKPVPQIAIETLLIEVSRRDSKDIGLEFGLDSYSSASTIKRIQYTITGNIEDIVTKGNIIAKPSLTVQNGRKAVFNMGDKYPVFTVNKDNGQKYTTVEFKDIGINIEATPRINSLESGLITMDLHPIMSNITRVVKNEDTEAPVISSREAQTLVRVKSNETILIANLLNDQDIETISGLPFFSKLPFFGKIFQNRTKSKEKSDIFILVTPRILYDEFNPKPEVEQPVTAQPPAEKEIAPMIIDIGPIAA